MPDVITWTVAGGSLVFAVGLISALGSRRQRKAVHQTRDLQVQMRESANKDLPATDASSLAARGVGNGRDDFATAGNNPR